MDVEKSSLKELSTNSNESENSKIDLAKYLLADLVVETNHHHDLSDRYSTYVFRAFNDDGHLVHTARKSIYFKHFDLYIDVGERFILAQGALRPEFEIMKLL